MALPKAYGIRNGWPMGAGQGVSAPPPVGPWILATGFWNDLGSWDDTASWID